MARPKVWNFETRNTSEQRHQFVAAQEDVVARAMQEYAPGTMFVTGPDIGRTDPQLILPYGGNITVDGVGRRVVVEY